MMIFSALHLLFLYETVCHLFVFVTIVTELVILRYFELSYLFYFI